MVKEAAVPSTQTSGAHSARLSLPSVGTLAVKCPKCKEMLVGRDWGKKPEGLSALQLPFQAYRLRAY